MGFEFDLIFLFGESETEENGSLEEEAEKHDDILIGSFVDSYDNLPLKTFLGFQYFSEFCTSKSVVIFNDSDAFILLDKIVKDFELIHNLQTGSKAYCIKGLVLPQAKNYRVNFYTSKWFVWL